MRSFAYISGGKDLFAGERSLLNYLALKASDIIEKVDAEDIPKLMASANSVDVNSSDYRFDPSGYVASLLEGLEKTRILSLLGLRAKRVALVMDNAGEAVIDLLCARRLSAERLVLIARSLPYELDITESELRSLLDVMGINAEVIGTGSDFPAFATDMVREDVLEVMRESDLVISKGIANMEAFLESRPVDPSKVLLMFRIKCSVLAEKFGMKIGTPLVICGEELLRWFR